MRQAAWRCCTRLNGCRCAPGNHSLHAHAGRSAGPNTGGATQARRTAHPHKHSTPGVLLNQVTMGSSTHPVASSTKVMPTLQMSAAVPYPDACGAITCRAPRWWGQSGPGNNRVRGQKCKTDPYGFRTSTIRRLHGHHRPASCPRFESARCPSTTANGVLDGKVKLELEVSHRDDEEGHGVRRMSLRLSPRRQDLVAVA